MIDSLHKFEAVVGTYYDHIKDGDLITAANIATASKKIAAAKPDLRGRITKELLKVDTIPLPIDECREIARGKALEAFMHYPVELDDNRFINDFIKRCL